MKIIKESKQISKVFDDLSYEWFFDCALTHTFVWFNSNEIPHFMKKVKLIGCDDSFSNLYRNAPDINGGMRRYYIGIYNKEAQTTLRDIYDRHKKESVPYCPIEKGYLQMASKKRDIS